MRQPSQSTKLRADWTSLTETRARQIDNLIYELYELTTDEIAIVEEQDR